MDHHINNIHHGWTAYQLIESIRLLKIKYYSRNILIRNSKNNKSD